MRVSALGQSPRHRVIHANDIAVAVAEMCVSRTIPRYCSRCVNVVERNVAARRLLLAEGENATSSAAYPMQHPHSESTPMAIKSNEGRGRTGSLSGRARSLLLSHRAPRSARSHVGPTLHRLARSILSSEQNLGILRGPLPNNATRRYEPLVTAKCPLDRSCLVQGTPRVRNAGSLNCKK